MTSGCMVSSTKDGSDPAGANPMPLHNPPGTIDHPTPAIEADHAYRLGSISESFADEMAGWRDRMENLIERYPWPTVILALGVGYLLARRMR